MTAVQNEFVALLAREYPDIKAHIIARVASELTRKGRSYARLQEAQCNGDYPADNGIRTVKACDRCGLSWAPESYVGGNCPDCRAEARIRKTLEALPGAEIIFQGDPRGCTVKLKLPSGLTNDWGKEGVCVPNS